MHLENYAKELYNLVINMRIQRNGHLGSRLDVGQGEADDRGGTPNVARGNGCHLSYFFIGNNEQRTIFMTGDILSNNFQ